MSIDSVRIKVELQGWQLQLMRAFSEHETLVKSLLEDELNKALSEDALRKLVSGYVESAVKRAIAETVDSYFRIGAGRDYIKQAAYQKLDEALGIAEDKV